MRVAPATLSRDEDDDNDGDMSFRLFILFFSHRLLSAFFHAEVIVEIVRADPTVRATRVRAQKCNNSSFYCRRRHNVRTEYCSDCNTFSIFFFWIHGLFLTAGRRTTCKDPIVLRAAASHGSHRRLDF